MATVAARGTGTPATTGTTWATTTNAVDGAAGTNPATYATLTSTTSGAVATIEVTGYGFSSSVGSTDTLNSVTVSLRHFENNTGRFASVTFQAFDGATAIGTATTCTLATAARNDVATPAVTLAQLRSSTFKVRVTITGAASTQSRIESIDYVDVTADYTPLPPAITQASYRFYADGTETGSTAFAAQDTGYTADTSAGDVNLQVRVRLQSTNAAPPVSTDDWQLQWEKNTSGTWAAVSGADNQVDSFAGGTTSGALFGTATKIGQSFLGNGRPLTRIGFQIHSITATSGAFVAELYAHTGTFGVAGGTATGTPLATSTPVDISTLVVGSWVYLYFDGSFTLTNATPYVIAGAGTVFDPPAAGVRLVYLGSDGHPGRYQTYNGTAWGSSNFDTNFRVYTATTSRASTTVIPYESANLTDGAATTNRLGAGTGSFVAGKLSQDGLVDDVGWTANNYTELLYSVTLKQADLTPADTLRFRVLRNAATTGMTYTATPTVTIGSAAPTDRTGVGTGAISVGGTSLGVRDTLGAATATLTVTGSASGSAAAAPVLGTASSTLTLSGTAAGTHGVAGTATGALTVAGVASGQVTVGATATGQLAVAGTASGQKTVTGVAVGSLTVAGVMAGVRPMSGVATGALTISGATVGTVTVTATASSSVTVTGTATGLHGIAGAATGQLALAGTASGQVTVTATASSSLTLSGSAAGVKTVGGVATGAVVVSSLALGLVEGNAVGTATGLVTVSGVAVGRRGTAGTATGQLALGGTSVGSRNVTALATGVVTLITLAVGRRGITGTATGHVDVDGTGSGSGVSPGGVVTIIGEWNDQQTTALQWGALQVVDWYMLVPSAVTGAGTATLTVTATAAGTAGTVGVATGTLTVTATAAGTVTSPPPPPATLLEPFNNLSAWTNTSGTIVAGRTGTAARFSGSTANAFYNIASGNQADTITIGFATQITAVGASNRHIVNVFSDSAAVEHIGLRYNDPTAVFTVVRAGATVLATSASGLITAATWYYLEFQAKLHDTAGTVTVRINGTPIFTLTNVDTRNAGTKTVFDSVRIGPMAPGSVNLYDDLYVRNDLIFQGDTTIP